MKLSRDAYPDPTALYEISLLTGYEIGYCNDKRGNIM